MRGFPDRKCHVQNISQGVAIFLESSAYAQCSFAYDTPLCPADAKPLLVTLTSFKVRGASRQVAREVWVRRGRDNGCQEA